MEFVVEYIDAKLPYSVLFTKLARREKQYCPLLLHVNRYFTGIKLSKSATERGICNKHRRIDIPHTFLRGRRTVIFLKIYLRTFS
jgi:hypothetical protein